MSTSSEFRNLFDPWKNEGSPLFASGLNNAQSVLNSNVKVRLGFLRKVYGILSMQLGLTALISVGIMLTPSIEAYLVQNIWLVFVNFLALLVTMGALFFKRNEYPTNFYLLGAFTFLNSLTLGVIISQYDADVIVQALFLTCAIVVGLTVYTFSSKSDFSWLGGVLSSLLLASFIGGIFHIFLRNSMTETLACVMGAAIFSAYIVYDTHMIMKHLSAEEYIVGVINLYLDIINLFIKILRLLQALKSQESSKKEKRKK